MPSLWAKHGTTHKLISEKCILRLKLSTFNPFLGYTDIHTNWIQLTYYYSSISVTTQNQPLALRSNLLSSNVVHTVADREVRRKVGPKENAQKSGPRCLKMGLSNVWNSHCFPFQIQYHIFQAKTGAHKILLMIVSPLKHVNLVCICIYIYGPYIYMYLGKPRPWPNDSRGSALSRHCHTLAAAHELRISWDHDHSI